MWVWARCFRCVVLPVIRFSSWVTFLVVGVIYGWWWWVWWYYLGFGGFGGVGVSAHCFVWVMISCAFAFLVGLV